MINPLLFQGGVCQIKYFTHNIVLNNDSVFLPFSIFYNSVNFMYDNLKSLGISNPQDIDRYTLRQEANNDILKIYFRKDKGEFFAKSVKFKYPRQRKTVAAADGSNNFKEINEINSNLRYAIEELDQICQTVSTDIDLKHKILDDLRHLEHVVSNKIAEIEADLEKLTRK
ncbi:hypothetical protein AHYW_003358 [Providencia manganoxydans]